MTEKEICAWLRGHYEAGRGRFHSGEVCPHAANTIAYTMDVLGWCAEDHYRALMEAKPSFGEEQRRIFAIREEELRQEKEANGQFGVGA